MSATASIPDDCLAVVRLSDPLAPVFGWWEVKHQTLKPPYQLSRLDYDAAEAAGFDMTEFTVAPSRYIRY